MASNSELLKQLKTLKLSGAAETLELRLMEAGQNQLSYSEVLQMILTDEIQLRQSRRLQRLISNARIESSKTIESFDFTFNASINAAQIRQLAACGFIEKAENIFFVGPTGTGKTHLAKALGHMACRKYMSVKFMGFFDLFSLLDKADLNNNLERTLKAIMKTDLLIIDDFAFKKIEQKYAEYFYTIVDLRYAAKSTIITSNRSMSDWINIFPDPIMANAIMDRLCHNTHQIIIKGESYRKKFRPKNQKT
ncbi:MAG TPA: IS21-like element helper ATPase IstB [Ignavibacteriaceae bacterium]|nr:IS21-like element helper ATPase IstB [Ignavibacteriaceae bacterium]